MWYFLDHEKIPNFRCVKMTDFTSKKKCMSFVFASSDDGFMIATKRV